jgi:hypothetical protein
MQYLVSVLDDTSDSATPDEMAAIDAYNDRLAATVIDNRGDEPLFTDGPFLESKEFVGGFWVIGAPDLDVALKLAAEGSKHCNRRVEVRPFL